MTDSIPPRTPQPMIYEAAQRLIVALDVPDSQQALLWVVRLGLQVKWFKIGLQLFTASGPALVREIQGRGASVFLDLKLHDIPNTVAQAIRSMAPLGAGMMTLHAGGGRKMMEAAAQAAKEFQPTPLLLAVTVLTSLDETALGEVGVGGHVGTQVERLARLAQASGLAGLVCSGAEVAGLRKSLGEGVRLVVPGIRPAGSEVGDQKRVMTPEAAMKAGADYLVIGRPILEAGDPNGEVERILSQMAAGMSFRKGNG